MFKWCCCLMTVAFALFLLGVTPLAIAATEILPHLDTQKQFPVKAFGPPASLTAKNEDTESPTPDGPTDEEDHTTVLVKSMTESLFVSTNNPGDDTATGGDVDMPVITPQNKPSIENSHGQETAPRHMATPWEGDAPPDGTSPAAPNWEEAATLWGSWDPNVAGTLLNETTAPAPTSMGQKDDGDIDLCPQDGNKDWGGGLSPLATPITQAHNRFLLCCPLTSAK